MTNEQRLVIERECERLILHSAKLSDHAKIEELAGLFTHDAELVRPSGVGASIVGRAAILASLRAAPKATKAHVITNVVVEVASPTSAHVASVAIRFSGPVADDGSGGTVAGTKIAVGYFEDDLVLTSEGWAFQASPRLDGHGILGGLGLIGVESPNRCQPLTLSSALHRRRRRYPR